MKYPLMGVIADCLEMTHHEAWFVDKVRKAFAAIAAERPDLVERYDDAFPRRMAGEVERLFLICQPLLEAQHDLWISSLRINGVTKRFHVGHSSLSVPLFPHIQGI